MSDNNSKRRIVAMDEYHRFLDKSADPALKSAQVRYNKWANDNPHRHDSDISFNEDMSEAKVVVGFNEDIECIRQNLQSPSDTLQVEIIDSGFDNTIEHDDLTAQVYCYLYKGSDSYKLAFNKNQHNIEKLLSTDHPEGKVVIVHFYTKDNECLGSLAGLFTSMQTNYD